MKKTFCTNCQNEKKIMQEIGGHVSVYYYCDTNPEIYNPQSFCIHCPDFVKEDQNDCKDFEQKKSCFAYLHAFVKRLCSQLKLFVPFVY
jgi:hypothetical protein